METWNFMYMPKSTSEVQGQNQAVTQMKGFLDKFPAKKSALLYGPPGCGKTCCVHALARENELEIIEVNASDARNTDSLQKKLAPATVQMSLFSKGKIILVDEIDGIAGNADRGGLTELSKLIEKSRFPVFLTANDPWDKKFTILRKKSDMIQFHTLAYPSVASVLKRICEKESVKYEDNALTVLARRAGGDLRGAINDLQVLCELDKELSQNDVDELSGRRQKETMINALMRILKTTNPEIALAALDDVDEDLDEVFLWMDENVPREYKNIEDIAMAYDNISIADVFRGRIRRWQHWRFLVYINNLLTAGVALSKKEKYHGFNKYTRTTRILKMWQYNQKNAKKKAVSQKLAVKTHTSARRAAEMLPYLKVIYKEKKGKAISEFLDLDSEEISYLKK
jgi:replication factor C large subunit